MTSVTSGAATVAPETPDCTQGTALLVFFHDPVQCEALHEALLLVGGSSVVLMNNSVSE